MLTVNPSLQKPEQNLSTDLSIHGRVAVALAFPADETAIAPWQAIMPTRQEVHSSMPAFWPVELQEDVPAGAKVLLRKQQKKLEDDLHVLTETSLVEKGASSSRDIAQLKEDYRYAWLLVNSRCFYWDYSVMNDEGLYAAVHGRVKKAGRAGKLKKLPRDDCMAMCPVMDYFNHADNEGVSGNHLELGKSRLILLEVLCVVQRTGFLRHC